METCNNGGKSRAINSMCNFLSSGRRRKPRRPFSLEKPHDEFYGFVSFSCTDMETMATSYFSYYMQTLNEILLLHDSLPFHNLINKY